MLLSVHVRYIVPYSKTKESLKRPGNLPFLIENVHSPQADERFSDWLNDFMRLATYFEVLCMMPLRCIQMVCVNIFLRSLFEMNLSLKA